MIWEGRSALTLSATAFSLPATRSNGRDSAIAGAPEQDASDWQHIGTEGVRQGASSCSAWRTFEVTCLWRLAV